MAQVSVIIPSYNTAHFLPQAIESVLAQTYRDFEIILINDGSTDATSEIAERYTKQHPDKIRYISQDNQGLAKARNTGIRHSRASYIALLDADDVWLPCRLHEGIKILEKDPSVGLVHGRVKNIDAQNREIATPSCPRWALQGHIFNELFMRRGNIISPTALFRRSCCDEVGGFDPYLTRLGCEDRDLWLRIAQKYKITYIDRIIAYYRVTTQSMSHQLDRMMQARLYVIDKYCPENNPHTLKLRRRALAKIFRDNGDEFLLKNDLITARQEYRKAIQNNPWTFWAWINGLKTLKAGWGL